MYVLNPTSEPKTIRYSSASRDCVDTCERITCDTSPVTVESASSIDPPTSICIAIASVAGLAIVAVRAYNDPIVHESALIVSTIAPVGSTTVSGAAPGTGGPEAGSTSRPTPARPIPTPMSLVTRGGCPCAHSQSTSQSGTVATRSDAIPELTRCSAHDTAPLPMNSSRHPTTAELFHSALVGC